jgi:transposase
MKQIYFMGIDISKEKIDCALIDCSNQAQLEKIIKNKQESIVTFLQQVVKKLKIEKESLLICCEETGLYTRPLKLACAELGIALWVESAFKIKKATTDLRGKSDKKDALRIAEYSQRYQDKQRIYVEPQQEEALLQNLLKAREAVLGQITRLEQELNETKGYDKAKHEVLKACYSKAIKVLKAEKRAIEGKIDKLAGAKKEIAQNAGLLRSITGVGPQVALEFIVYTHNFRLFSSPKQLACYAGVAPFPNESGTITKRSRVSNYANKKLKKLLHLAAMAASRAKGELRDYYIRKVKEGKNKMAVLNAIRNKLVHRMFAVIRRQTPYSTTGQDFSIN